MKTLLTFIFALAFATSSSFGAITPTDQQKLYGINYLSNPGFEQSSASWTASGGAITQANQSAKGDGSNGYDWDSNASGQTLVSESIPVPPILFGKNGLAYCYFKTVSGTATHTITVDNGSGTNYVTPVSIVSSSTFQKAVVNFPFPTSSANMRIKISSVASNEPEIYIDSCFIGEALNVGSVSVDTDWISYTPTFTGFGTVSGVEFESRRIGGSLEIKGKFVSGTSTATEARITLGYNGVNGNVTSSAFTSIKVAGGVSVRSGSGTDQIYPLIEPSVGYLTFGIQGSAGGITKANGSGFVASGNTFSFTASVPIAGWTAASAQTVRTDFFNWRVDANIGGANPNLGTSAQSAYIGIEDAGLTLTNNTGANVISAQIPCSGTNASTGTTCSTGNESVGVAFTAPAKTDVLACASFTHNLSIGTGSLFATFQIVQTPNNAQTISAEGRTRVSSSVNTANTHILFPHRVCGTFSIDPGLTTFRLMYEQAVGSSVNQNVLAADGLSTAGQRDIHWEVYPIASTVNVPVFVGSVTSNTSGVERIERVEVGSTCSASPCTITSQSGSWVSSVTRTGTGAYTVNFAASMFSAAPTCTCIAGGFNGAICSKNGSTSSSASFATFSGTTATDANFNVVCMGPR